jgi:hypothetical protein
MKSCGLGSMIERPAEVALPLAARSMVAGSTWVISSNCEEILTAVQETFQPAQGGAGTTDLKRFAPTPFETTVEPPGASVLTESIEASS